MSSLCGTTRGKTMFKEFKKTQIQYNLKWNLLRCVKTDSFNLKKICMESKKAKVDKFTNLIEIQDF